jgi:serine/threonine protein phosphatase PrpC
MIQCPQCHAENQDGAAACAQCGAALTPPAPRPVLMDTRPLADDSTRPLGDAAGTARPITALRAPLVSASADATSPLPELADIAFAPLPAGALVHGGRYEILELWSENEQENTYLAAGGDPFVICPTCDTLARAEGQTHCASCHASLAGVPLLTATFVLKESRYATHLAAETAIAALQLDHPALVAPVDACSETPYGAVARYYVVMLEPPPLRAKDLSVPQELPQIIDWGLQLARALAYLHHHNVTFNQITPNHVALSGKRALWVDFSTCTVLAGRTDAAARAFAGDVEDLARLLLYLTCGQTVYTEDLRLPAPVAPVFREALTGAGFPRAEQLATALEAAQAEVRRPSGVDVRQGRLSDVGQLRQLNEDSLLTIDLGRVSRSTSRPLGVYAVADGMGGHAAGDIASRLVVDTLARHALSELILPTVAESTRPLDVQAWLINAVQTANRAVLDQRRAANTDMGSTLVMAVLDGATARIANVGDSRAYLINAAGIRRLTIDHSLVERLIATGQLTPEEARRHPQRNVIYRTMGDRAQVEVDTFVQVLAPGDRLLLCSDGLSGMLEDSDLQRIVMQASSPQDACRQLIAAANANGGDDNITAIVLQIESAETPADAPPGT